MVFFGKDLGGVHAGVSKHYLSRLDAQRFAQGRGAIVAQLIRVPACHSGLGTCPLDGTVIGALIIGIADHAVRLLFVRFLIFPLAYYSQHRYK